MSFPHLPDKILLILEDAAQKLSLNKDLYDHHLFLQKSLTPSLSSYNTL